MTNVVFVKNLKAFVYLLHNHMSFKDVEFFGNDDKDFFYFKISEEIEFRNWDRFEPNTNSGADFIKRLSCMRDFFKGENVNRLGLEKHFRTTKAHDMWEDIKYRYYLKSQWNQNYVKSLLPQTIEEYELMFNLNRASFYYTNSDYFNKIVAGIKSYDISSSHIGFMSREKFPSSSFKKVESNFQSVIKDEKKGWMGCFCFDDLKYKVDLPINKGFWIERVCDEAGIATNSYCVYLTNIDIKWFKQIFSWSKVYVWELYECRMDFLPKEYINMIDSLYQNKNAQKKGTFGKEICKFRAELPFGQSIKKVEYDGELKYNEKLDCFEIIDTKPLDIDEIRKKLIRRGIPVQVGLWTVAYSRLELVNIILKIGIENIVYADTDCVKFIGDKGEAILKERNKEIDQKIKENKSNCYQLNEKLGRWEKEDVCAIKVIGVKWYMTIDSKDNYDVKCAGANKDNLLEWIKDKGFYGFNRRMKCPKLFKTVKTFGKTLILEQINGFNREQLNNMNKLVRQLIIS